METESPQGPPTVQCIYCDIDKPANEFSLEHIFPDSFGGMLCSDLFKTRQVCRRCNSTMGMFVDGPVIKNWFTKNAEAAAFREFVDPDSPECWLPFVYIGPAHHLELAEDEVCEVWLGPYGEHLYHFHNADDPRYDTYVGGNPIARRDDPGRAYLFLTETDEKKYALTVRSFVRQFAKVTRYAGNFKLQQADEQAGVIQPLPQDRIVEHASLEERASSGTQVHAQIAIQLGFEGRFLAKLARGIGFNLFKAAYLETTCSKNLQKAIWERDPKIRSGLMRGMGLFNDMPPQVKERTGIRGTYSILLSALRDVFCLCLTLPDGKMLSVVISDEPALWAGDDHAKYRDGVLYVIAPQVSRFIGPVAFPSFLAYSLGKMALPEVDALEQLRVCRI